MVATIKTFSFIGIEVVEVDVQVKITSGFSGFSIVGLPDKSVGESKERVIAALSSTGLSLPNKKITVNLAPADLQKEGAHFDLPIAIGILIELGIISNKAVENLFILGELALDGSISSINGIISAAIGANQRNCGIICPKANIGEALWAGEMEIIGPHNLIAIINHLKQEQFLEKPVLDNHKNNFSNKQYPDFADVKGHKQAKRGLEIAASGGHNLLMIGPPGTGKSMLASCLPGILPNPTVSEILEINMIHSVSGKITDGKLITHRPYREVHHSCSMAAMVGGGSKAKPGEISLAHNGILFLDEMAEFPHQVLDSLRQPLETGKVDISRVNSHITYPANFQLIAAMNPCRCGYLGDAKRECKKAPNCGEDYQKKISGPLLDRIDLIINVEQIDHFERNHIKGEDSAKILERVSNARIIQKNRYQNYFNDKNCEPLNSMISGRAIEEFCRIDDETEKIFNQFVNKAAISMRGIIRILRVARTIADLENSENIERNHLLEALTYRRRL
jgi:magnesium chelatase family protein